MHEFQRNPDAVFANASQIAVNEEEKTDVENHRSRYRNSVEILNKLQNRGLEQKFLCGYELASRF